MVLPCGILGGFFLPPIQGRLDCPKPPLGTFANATEACISCFSGRGTFGCWFLHRTRPGRLLSEGLVESWSARRVYVIAAGGNHRLRSHLRLSSHRAPPQVTSPFDDHHRDCASALPFCPRLNIEWPIRSDGTNATRWTTHRFLTARHCFSDIQTDLLLDRTQRVDHKTDVFVDIHA